MREKLRWTLGICSAKRALLAPEFSVLLHREYPTNDSWLTFGDGFWRRNCGRLETVQCNYTLIFMRINHYPPGMDEDNNNGCSRQDVTMRW